MHETTDFKKAEHKVYSQAGQDGVLAAIFIAIGTTNKFFVEFGAGDGVHLSNTANLALNKGWKGLLMDKESPSHIVSREVITAENIEHLLAKHKVPLEFDYLSIDLDGNDWWVWQSINRFSPRVVSIEFNSNFSWDESVTIPYVPDRAWDGTSYFGASLAALHKLGKRKGYVLVHIVENLDAFFVRHDCMNKRLSAKTPKELLPNPIPCFGGLDARHWTKIL